VGIDAKIWVAEPDNWGQGEVFSPDLGGHRCYDLDYNRGQWPWLREQCLRLELEYPNHWVYYRRSDYGAVPFREILDAFDASWPLAMHGREDHGGPTALRPLTEQERLALDAKRS
jgi:hypothetical protein